jgi:hypothetical protein
MNSVKVKINGNDHNVVSVVKADKNGESVYRYSTDIGTVVDEVIKDQFNTSSIRIEVLTRELESLGKKVDYLEGQALVDKLETFPNRNLESRIRLDKYKIYLSTTGGSGRNDSYERIILSTMGLSSVKELKIGLEVSVQKVLDIVGDHKKLGKALDVKFMTSEKGGYQLAMKDLSTYAICTYNKKVVRK